MKTHLGFTPVLPKLGQGMSIRGCCVSHFKGKIAGSYVVDTDEGIVSVIVVTDHPKALGMKQTIQHEGRTFGKGSFAKCNMVTARVGDLTYCAVAEVLPHRVLTELLTCLLY